MRLKTFMLFSEEEDAALAAKRQELVRVLERRLEVEQSLAEFARIVIDFYLESRARP